MIGLNPTDNIVAREFDKSGFVAALTHGKKAILDECISVFNKTSKLNIVFGFEIEFYIRFSDENLSYAMVSDLLNEACKEIDLFDFIEQEKGEGQYEVKTKANSDAEYSLEQVDLMLEAIKICCENQGFEAIFDARPYKDDCPNAFQVNFSLNNKNGENILANNAKITSQIADFITFHLDELLIFSNEKDEDFARYDYKYNLALFKKGNFIAPTTKSWGFDNRSCAVRVLNSEKYGKNARIELRIASNNIKKHLFLAATAIILGNFFDIVYYKEFGQQIYGNSFDEKYSLKKIAMNYSGAMDDFFKEGGIVFPAMLKILEAQKTNFISST